MEKTITEILTALREKVSSPLIRYFSISWILWNYKIMYFIFIQDQKIFFDAHNITKYDYLLNFSFYDIWYISILFYIVLPLISALFFIYIFPLFNIKVLNTYIWTIDKEAVVKQKHRKAIKKRDLEIAKMELKEKETEVKVVEEEIKKSKTEKEKKDLEGKRLIKEFKEFQNTEEYLKFGKLIEIINFEKWFFWSDNRGLKIPKNDVSYYLANKIIEKSEKNSSYHNFTEKWQYFSKLYFNE